MATDAASVLFTVLTLCSWTLVGALIYLLFRIARFYETKYAELYRDTSPQQTYSILFLIPITLFLLAAGRSVLSGSPLDPLADLAFLVGGVLLAATSYHLYRLMMGRRR